MITNINEKLNGELPVNRKELFTLVSSWGRKDNFLTNDEIFIDRCEEKECYDLSNLDVSQIEDLSEIFKDSYFNGDISNWNLSNCINMDRMFAWSDFNNDSLKDWNISNVITMNLIFCCSKFNENISNWDISNVENMNEMFYCNSFDGDISNWNFNKYVSCYNIVYKNDSFLNKYNDGKSIEANKFVKWFEDNRDKIKKLNASKEEILDFFSFNNDNLKLN